MPTNLIFSQIFCHVWQSNYLFEASYVFGALTLIFLVGNRAIQITGKYQDVFAPSLCSDLTYLIIIGLASVLSVICQAFLVEWNGRYCRCPENVLPYWILVAAYVAVFVRFGLAVIISPIILCVSCYKIVQWVRYTPAAELSDTWNGLILPRATEAKVTEKHRPRGWMTASMCTVPLSINFVAFSIYINTYQFSCAVGMCTLVFDSATYRICFLVIPYHLFSTNKFLAPILCHTWSSCYFSCISYNFDVLVLNFIVGHRAIQITCKYQFSFSNSVIADLTNLGLIGLTCITILLSQALIVSFDGKYCRCRDTEVSYELLVALYTETFVRFGLAVVLSAIILRISCYKIILWMCYTPSD
ncbi:unnamed protein product [Schistocephalus solidus]|uniref:G protein-coupled receptor n=1 Tax=Schistocephalus solidus TaxID=70667 RepID=A0A183TJV4_SCHSO|nr:unnamed protein product [Schistocephalus solidus]